jgi:hypothetical protein
MNNGKADTDFYRRTLPTKSGNNQAAIANYQTVKLLHSAQGKQATFLTANW